MKRLYFWTITVIFVLSLFGTSWAKQWSDYDDFSGFPDPSDTLLFRDISDPTTADGLQKEITLSYFFGAFELKPVYYSAAGVSTYTIDLSTGNVFFVNQVGHSGLGGVTVYLPKINAGTSQYANRPYTIINDTVSGTSKMWLVPQFDTGQCTQWVVSESGVSTSQSGVSAQWHNRMDGRMDAVTILPRYVGTTSGATHYVIKDLIR